jgi:hypothetical protein
MDEDACWRRAFKKAYGRRPKVEELTRYKYWHGISLRDGFDASGPWECWPARAIPPERASAGSPPKPVVNVVGNVSRLLCRPRGPRAAEIEAAAQVAAIPERALLAAADALGVRSQRGEWWLPRYPRPGSGLGRLPSPVDFIVVFCLKPCLIRAKTNLL